MNTGEGLGVNPQIHPQKCWLSTARFVFILLNKYGNTYVYINFYIFLTWLGLKKETLSANRLPLLSGYDTFPRALIGESYTKV